MRDASQRVATPPRGATMRAVISYIDNMGRRDFLKASAVAAALLAAPASLLASRSAHAAVPEGIRFMSPSEYAVFERLMKVMLPLDGTPLVPLAQIPVLATLDVALLGTMPPHILAGLKGGIAYFDEGPVAEHGKRFTELPDDDAARFCDTWADSTEPAQRALAMGLKKLVGLAYWANPPTWEPLGYEGPVSERWGLKSLGNAPMPSA